MLYLEDFAAGQTIALGSRTLTEEAILAFAREFDPQPFHIDPEAARASIYGGLIASGWHTAATLMRLLVDGVLGDSASLGSPGIDEIRWKLPVRPGDTLSANAQVLEVVPSSSRPDRGVVHLLYTVRNQRDEVVMTMRGMGLMRRRPESAR
jgi:Acyl dehydratase